MIRLLGFDYKDVLKAIDFMLLLCRLLLKEIKTLSEVPQPVQRSLFDAS